MTLTHFAIIAVCAYLLGSLSFAIIVSKVTLGKDIRNYGSGNAGLTNAYRTMGAKKTLFVLLGDIAKGAAAVSVGWALGGPVGKLTAGIFVILGHMFPLYFGFKGGKGVVTAAALMLTEDWRVFIAIIVTFLIIFLCSKIISLASVLCAILYAPYTFAMTFIFDFIIYKDYSLTYVIFSTAAALLIGVFVIVKHKENIKRLLKGEEKKITAKK